MSATDYKPGTVAKVADPVHGELTAILIGEGCWHASVDGELRCLASDAITSAEVRPLLVLDLHGANPNGNPEIAARNVIERLRNGTAACRGIADQIEAQTRPPRCEAALIIKGEHFFCDSQPGHTLPHGSRDAEAIWGGVTA